MLEPQGVEGGLGCCITRALSPDMNALDATKDNIAKVVPLLGMGDGE